MNAYQRGHAAMNYIKRLQEENKTLREALAEAKRGMGLLEAYVHSEKYHNDPYVNNKDISLRIGETLHNVASIEVQGGIYDA
jgi:hypothetical protein